MKLNSITLALALALLSVPISSSACGNSVEELVDPEVSTLQRAEAALRADRPEAAARAVLEAFPSVQRSRASGPGHEARAQRIVAVAIGRLDGDIALGGGFGPRTPQARVDRLAWAEGTLRRLAAAQPAHIGIRTDLAEFLALRPTMRAEGARSLEELAFRELITSSHAWRTLAQLRQESGRYPERDLALRRCRAMTRAPARCALSALVAAR